MLTVSKKDYPYLYAVLDVVWADNIPEFRNNAEDTYTWEPDSTYDLEAVDKELGKLDKEQLEIMAAGDYDDRVALIEQKPELKETERLIDSFFLVLLDGEIK